MGVILRPVRRQQPTLREVHIDAALTQMSVAFMQSQQDFIFPKVAPMIPVDKQTDKYWVFPREDWLRDEAKKRTDSTESAGGGYTVSTDSYYADVWAYHRDLGSQLLANADAALQLERGAVQFVTSKLMLRQEVQWINDFFVPGIWTNQLTGVVGPPATADEFVYWDDYADSDPFEDIEEGKERIAGVTGIDANTLVLSQQVWRKLKRHPLFRDQIKYTSAANMTTGMLASLLEIENVYIIKSIRNTAVEGATPAYARNAGKHAWLGYVNPNPAPYTASAMYSFGWTGVAPGLATAVGIDSFEIRKLKTTRYEGEVAFDNKIISNELGVFYNGAVSP